MPKLNFATSNSDGWKTLEDGKRSVPAKEGRLIETVRFRVQEALGMYLEGMSENNEWPYPPPLVKTISSPSTTLLLLVSLDSGTGTLKLMCRFIIQTSGQSTGGIIYLGESRNTSEDYDDVCSTFGESFEEIQTIRDEGIDVLGKHYDVQILFVADFKVLY